MSVDDPTDPAAIEFSPFARGIRYLRFLVQLAAARQPQTYFEIGTAVGNSLAIMDCAAVSVDPGYRIEQNVMGKKPSLMLFQMPSDDFFARHRLSNLLPAPHHVDLAFLDGMHHFEFLLRDFINTERYCTPDSVVILHDCLPVRPIAARRHGPRRPIATDSRRKLLAAGGGWTGDVWKVLRILQQNRPDLRITCIDCPPSGLVVITGCNPDSTVLAKSYDALVADWMDADLRPGWFDALHDGAPLAASRRILQAEALRRAIGLTAD
jgi:hypothetical protein